MPRSRKRKQTEEADRSSPLKSPRKYMWLDAYEENYGLEPTEWKPGTTTVSGANCKFCLVFGREDTQKAQPVRVEPGQKKKKSRGKRLKPHAFTKGFNPANITKHMVKQHPTKWKEYQTALANRQSDPDTLKKFFAQRKITAFFLKESQRNGIITRFIEKDIIDVLVKGILLDQRDNAVEGSSGLPPHDRAMSIFQEVLDEDGNVQGYNFTIKNQEQFKHVTDLVGRGFSFCQIQGSVASVKESFKIAGKIGCVSQGDASNMARIACAQGFQLLSAAMRNSWAFSIGADESNNGGADSHLDVRIQFPAIRGTEQNDFHLMAIPMHDRSHTGEEYASAVKRVLNVLCPEWRVKLIGTSTDGAGNMAGHVGGYSTRLMSESDFPDIFFRVWCLAHQLDLVIKKVSNELGLIYNFLPKLNEIIKHLRAQQTLTAAMGCRCPYYVATRWSSLVQVTSWMIQRKQKLRNHFANDDRHIPSESW